ncbi:hypothetical protein BKA93DRAFT_745260, partial [Sparassis latifolia]
MSDPEGDKLSGRSFTAAAIRSIVNPTASQPDLVVHHGMLPVSEYNNPNLFPGMFPTLYPFGIGGFEDPSRPKPIEFDTQVNYYLDLADKAFRYHHMFMFIALNIWQRRSAHLHTHFAVQKPYFQTIARRLVTLSPSLLMSVSNHLENEGKYADLTDQQKDALDLLKHVNTIGGHIPGSQASKIRVRNEIRSYFGYFGMPHIYMTINPSPAHNPIFQVMYGDTTVDLAKRFPLVVPAHERALRLAKDPVAACDFFYFCIHTIFEDLLGWDFSKRRSKRQGGILGKLRAFYGTPE